MLLLTSYFYPLLYTFIYLIMYLFVCSIHVLGVVVDCYQHAGMSAKTYRQLHSRKATWEKREMAIRKDNAILKKNIQKLKSPYSVAQMDEDYKKNRYM